jgi:hypothetical protein
MWKQVHEVVQVISKEHEQLEMALNREVSLKHLITDLNKKVCLCVSVGMYKPFRELVFQSTV